MVGGGAPQHHVASATALCLSTQEPAMNTDSEPIDQPMPVLVARPLGGLGAHPNGLADLLADIGYEAADPWLQGLPWHEAVHSPRNKRER